MVAKINPTCRLRPKGRWWGREEHLK